MSNTRTAYVKREATVGGVTTSITYPMTLPIQSTIEDDRPAILDHLVILNTICHSAILETSEKLGSTAVEEAPKSVPKTASKASKASPGPKKAATTKRTKKAVTRSKPELEVVERQVEKSVVKQAIEDWDMLIGEKWMASEGKAYDELSDDDYTDVVLAAQEDFLGHPLKELFDYSESDFKAMAVQLKNFEVPKLTRAIELAEKGGEDGE